MDFENELTPGVLIKRYKRFFVDIKLKNKIITAHCPNPGSMIKLLNKGNPVWITKSNNVHRKLKYTLQIIQVDKIKICLNTPLTDKIVQEAINKGSIKELKDLKPVNNSQSDLLKAMDLVIKTGKGPKDQIPSMGCNIKWIK